MISESKSNDGVRPGGGDKPKSHKVRGEHCLSVFVSFELKDQVRKLAKKYDRTTADILRALIRIGIPMMEGLSRAEEIMVREYVDLFRKLRRVRSIKEI